MTTWTKDGRTYTHGTSNSYVNGKCRCDVCRDAQTAKARIRTRKQAYGQFVTQFVDAEPARRRVNEFRAMGVGVKQVAKMTGIAPSVLGALVFGRGPAQQASYEKPRPAVITKIKRVNSEKILSLSFDVANLLPGTNVSAQGTHRRIQALAAIGYSLSWQAEQIGWKPANIHVLLKHDKVQIKTVLLVNALFDAYSLIPRRATDWHTKTSITRSINIARKNKWQPPLAWDSIDFDKTPVTVNKEQFIDKVKLDLILLGDKPKLNRLENRWVAAELLRMGKTYGQIDNLLGKAPGTARLLLQRNEVDDAA
jgi:hypothetical protein